MSCGEKYRLMYVKKMEMPVATPLIIGRVVHKAVEENLKRKMESGVLMQEEEYLDVVVDSSIEEMKDKDIEFKEGETEQDVNRTISTLANLHYTNVAPKLNPAAIEQKVTIPLTENYDFLGIIDLINLSDSGEHEIHDLKCKGKRPSKGDADESIQFTGYAFAVSYLKSVEGVDLNVNPDRIKILQTSLVSNKTPVVDQQESTRGPSHFRQFIDLFQRVAHGIKSEAFYPGSVSGFGSTCGYCQYTKICIFRAQEV